MTPRPTSKVRDLAPQAFRARAVPGGAARGLRAARGGVAALGAAGRHRLPVDGQLADGLHHGRPARRARRCRPTRAAELDRAARPLPDGRLRVVRPAAALRLARSRRRRSAPAPTPSAARSSGRCWTRSTRARTSTGRVASSTRIASPSARRSSAARSRRRSRQLPGVDGVVDVRYRRRGQTPGFVTMPDTVEVAARRDRARRQRPEPTRARLAARGRGGGQMSATSSCPCDAFVHPQVVANPAGLSGDRLPRRRLRRRSATRCLRARAGEVALADWHPAQRQDLARAAARVVGLPRRRADLLQRARDRRRRCCGPP